MARESILFVTQQWVSESWKAKLGNGLNFKPRTQHKALEEVYDKSEQ